MNAKIHAINIDDTNYVASEELFNKAPIYTKGCRNARELIKKKSIGENNYIFAAKNKKKEEWKVTDGSSKKTDQVLFVYDWIQNNIPEINEENGNKKDEYPILPKELHLRDEEKFQDNEGNRIHIQVVGEREHDKCYFRVKDVMEGFGMNNLNEILIDKRNGYNELNDYVYFKNQQIFAKSMKKSFKKDLYLTYRGFQRIIECSRKTFGSDLKFVLHKWLQQFDTRLLKSYKINVRMHIEISKIGYTYCITSPMINAVKIGFWTSTLESLKSRYVTYFGNDVDIFSVRTADAYKLEQKCHMHFIEKKICNELFDKRYIEEYKNYLKNNQECILEEDMSDNNKSKIEYGYDLEYRYDYENEHMYDDAEKDGLSCVYLVALNSVKNLRENMNIDQKYGDDMFVCKYGFSKDFKKRMETHKQEYKHIKGVNLSLKNIALIDPKYISNAEKDIKEFVANYSFQFEKFDELVILDKKDFVELEKYYSLLSLKYRGYNEDLNNMITGLRLSIRDIEHNHKMDLLQKDKELLQKERELDLEKAKVREEKLKYESLEKDVKILEMEKRLYQMQYNNVPAEKVIKKSIQSTKKSSKK